MLDAFAAATAFGFYSAGSDAQGGLVFMRILPVQLVGAIALGARTGRQDEAQVQ